MVHGWSRSQCQYAIELGGILLKHYQLQTIMFELQLFLHLQQQMP